METNTEMPDFVKAMASHSSIQTTVRYDRRPEEAKQRVEGVLHVERFR